MAQEFGTRMVQEFATGIIPNYRNVTGIRYRNLIQEWYTYFGTGIWYKKGTGI